MTMEPRDTSFEEHLSKKITKLKSELLESIYHQDSGSIDPLEPHYDVDGRFWSLLGNMRQSQGSISPVTNETFFNEIRNQSRMLALSNEFAINAFENRINYTIGSGHRYHAIPEDVHDTIIIKEVHEIIEEFQFENQWSKRHKEIVRRMDRDGEVFIRLFPIHNGPLKIRFIEPEQIATPQKFSPFPDHSLGIHTAPDDVETILGYWVDEEYVEGKFIQHRRNNVDFNVKRGIPLLYPVRKNLHRVEKLLRNMSIVAEIQSAIALIRKHNGISSEGIRQFVQNQNTEQSSASSSGQTMQKFVPGTIIDAHNGVDYQFPISAIDASRYILILQAELRAIAARLVLPEFMLSSDASNANYSSTMVAEGPAVRMFERLQNDIIEEDNALYRHVINHAISIHRLPSDTWKRMKLHIIPPTLAVRDRLKEARADEILFRCGIMSAQTMSMRNGLDPKKEANLDCHCCSDNSTQNPKNQG